MIADDGDFENMRQFPYQRAFGQIGKGQYKHNNSQSKFYNDFMKKPDSRCSEQEIRTKHFMAQEAGDIDNMR